MTRRAANILGASAVHGRSIIGNGQMIAICDTGFDLGSATDSHPFIPPQRLRSLLAYPKRKTADDPHGHGTHVGACAAAEMSANGAVCGTAPGASIVMQSVYQDLARPFGNRPIGKNFVSLLNDAYVRSARIHSNSWVQDNSSSEYSRTAEDIDRFVCDHQDFVVVCAVGNEGWFLDPASSSPALQTIRSPAVAKNAISVGGSENELGLESPELERTYGHFFPPKLSALLPPTVRDDRMANDLRHWVAFSGCGPTADGRIKPDVLAPATSVISARSRRGFVASDWGEVADENCAVLGGTSVAAPLVAGCCALIREQLISAHRILTPSAALVRAVLINGTSQDVLFSNNDPIGRFPNSLAGWGRVDVERSLGFKKLQLLVVDNVQVRFDGDVWETTINSVPSSEGLRVTLTWTDPAGRGLQSDLDLEVECAGKTLLGNGGKSFDRVNNCEHVRLDEVPESTIVIRVRAFRLQKGAQAFAIAILAATAGQ